MDAQGVQILLGDCPRNIRPILKKNSSNRRDQDFVGCFLYIFYVFYKHFHINSDEHIRPIKAIPIQVGSFLHHSTKTQQSKSNELPQ